MSLKFDPEEAVLVLSKADPNLKKLIKAVGPFTMRPQKLQSPFEALARAIVYQQLSGRVAAVIHARLAESLKKRGGLTPEAISKSAADELRAVGMSWAKVAALHDLAAKTIDGTVPTLAGLRKLDDAVIVERLTQVRGIGPWTVEMMLMFRLGRPDVLPISDLGVRRGFMLTYGLKEMPKPKALVELAEHWRPYRTVASWYMWRACELENKQEKKAEKSNGGKKPVKKAAKKAAKVSKIL